MPLFWLKFPSGKKNKNKKIWQLLQKWLVSFVVSAPPSVILSIIFFKKAFPAPVSRGKMLNYSVRRDSSFFPPFYCTPSFLRVNSHEAVIIIHVGRHSGSVFGTVVSQQEVPWFGIDNEWVDTRVVDLLGRYWFAWNLYFNSYCICVHLRPYVSTASPESL